MKIKILAVLTAVILAAVLSGCKNAIGQSSGTEDNNTAVSEPVKTTVPDPDDDFKMIDGEFYPDQWQDFQPPVLPKGFIYTIIYGQEYKQSKQKIFIIRGISNGLETEMTVQIK